MEIAFKLKERQFRGTSSSKVSLMQHETVQVLVVITGALVILYVAASTSQLRLQVWGSAGLIACSTETARKSVRRYHDHLRSTCPSGRLLQGGDYLGTVENIGLRSTRLRTLKRTVVSIPNGQLALMSLENFAMRDKTWFHHTLHLRYETTADQLRYILAEIRKMLYGHSKVESASARIRFVRFGNSSLDLEVFAYVLETEYEPFLHIQEDLLLRIMDIIEASGSGFALPSQTTYLAGDSGLDTAKSQKAIETVRQWREQRKLPFPDFPPETISEIDGKIEYPPPESALRNKRKE
jgi:MscS family membrane protein